MFGEKRHGGYRLAEPVEPPPDRLSEPDPVGVTTLPELTAALRQAKVWAGSPGFRKISRRCADGLPSATTFHSLLKGERLFDLNIVLIFIEALGLGGDLDRWAEAWHRVDDSSRRAS